VEENEKNKSKRLITNILIESDAIKIRINQYKPNSLITKVFFSDESSFKTDRASCIIAGTPNWGEAFL
jgi:hypothetical protein